jgi:hypothetical protein
VATYGGAALVARPHAYVDRSRFQFVGPPKWLLSFIFIAIVRNIGANKSDDVLYGSYVTP